MPTLTIPSGQLEMVIAEYYRKKHHVFGVNANFITKDDSFICQITHRGGEIFIDGEEIKKIILDDWDLEVATMEIFKDKDSYSMTVADYIRKPKPSKGR